MLKSLAILLVFACVASFKGFAATSEKVDVIPKDMTVAKLLALYEREQQKTYRSFISRTETETHEFLSHHNILQPGHRKARYAVEVRTDGWRHYWSEEYSGQCFPTLRETTPATDPRIKWFLFDGRFYYTSAHEPMWIVNQAVARIKPDQKLWGMRRMLEVRISDEIDPISPFTILCRYKPGQGALLLPPGIGTLRFLTDNFLIPKLKNSHSTRLEPDVQTVDGTKCYVLKGTLHEVTVQPKEAPFTNEYLFRIHFSLDLDWNIVRIEKANTSRRMPGTKAGYTLVTRSLVDNVRLEKVNERWAPMEWRVTTQSRRLNSLFEQNDTNYVKRVKLLLNPDHDALGSFKPSFVKDGSAVRLEGLGNRYKGKTNLLWTSSQVVDESGRTAVDLSTGR